MRSEHPLGKAVVRCYKKDAGKAPEQSNDFNMLPGRGVTALVNSQRVLAGNKELLEEQSIVIPETLDAQTKEDVYKRQEVYTDEGISGTSTKHRAGFNRMVSDALEGKIDLIVTKSISRFARNTIDTLTTVRRLKEKGVEVYFEKENIYTLDSKGELLITIMSSIAQEESRSISENVTWGQRKRFSDGKEMCIRDRLTTGTPGTFPNST